MTNKEKGLALLGVLLLIEAFMDRAISRTAKSVGVSGGALAVGGLVAAGIVAALD